MSQPQATAPGEVHESSGTTFNRAALVSPFSDDSYKTSPESPIDQPSSPTSEGENKALESHEVIELQTFSERKAWIEEKIKVISTLS